MQVAAPFRDTLRGSRLQWALAAAFVVFYALFNLPYSLSLHQEYPDATPSYLVRAIIRTTLAGIMAVALLYRSRVARWSLIAYTTVNTLALVSILLRFGYGVPDPRFNLAIDAGKLVSAGLLFLGAGCLLRLRARPVEPTHSTDRAEGAA